MIDPKFQINLNSQLPNLKQFWSLKFGIWILFGIWSLELGASNIDSLKARLAQTLHDTDRIMTMNYLFWELCYSNPDTALIVCSDGLTLAKRTNWPKGIGTSYNNLASVYYLKGDYPQSIRFFLKCLALWETVKNQPESYIMHRKSMALGNIGTVYEQLGDYQKSLEYHSKALIIDEKLGNKKSIATTLGNIGVVYRSMADDTRNNAVVRDSLYAKAVEYYMKALKIDEEINNKRGIARHLGNIGVVYDEMDDHIKALEYYNKRVQLDEELGNLNYMSINLGNIGSLYTEIGLFGKAEEYLLRSLSIAESLGSLDDIRAGNQHLSELYDTTGRYQLAYEHYKKYTAAKDSIFNEEKSKDIGRLEAQHEFDKQQAIAQAGHEKELQLAAEREKRQQVLSYSAAGGLLLVLIFALFIWNRFRVTQRQKKIIEQQKKTVEEKQEEIYASMRYAKRIQDALLPKNKYIESALERLKKKPGRR